jgi:hypothetical protein
MKEVPQFLSSYGVSLSLALTLTTLIYILKRTKQNQRAPDSTMKLTVPRGPICLPFVGNLLQLGSRPFEKLFEMTKHYGPVFQIKLGSETVVVLNGTDTIREALIDYGTEFAGRPKLYMIHAILKGKGLISSPFNDDYSEHKNFLLKALRRFGKRHSSLEINCLQTIRETLDEYRASTDLTSEEFTHSTLKNSLSQIASQNILTMTFGNRMHDKQMFGTLMDLITENFKNSAISGAFNFLPVTRIFKACILKNAVRCSVFLNDLISEKIKEFNEHATFEYMVERERQEQCVEGNFGGWHLKTQ